MVRIARSSSVMSSSRDNSRAPGRLRAVSSGCGLGAGYANLAAQNFPGGALGQLVDEPHLAGVFVGSDPVFDEGADLRGGGADARFEHDGELPKGATGKILRRKVRVPRTETTS